WSQARAFGAWAGPEAYPRPTLQTLFVPERVRGRDSRGASGWDRAGQEGDSGQDDRGGDEGNRVGGMHSVEQGRHQPGEENGSDGAEGEAGGNEEHTVANDQTHDFAAGGAQGHADTDLLGAASDRIGHDTVDADHGEYQRGGSEDAEQPAEES